MNRQDFSARWLCQVMWRIQNWKNMLRVMTRMKSPWKKLLRRMPVRGKEKGERVERRSTWLGHLVTCQRIGNTSGTV